MQCARIILKPSPQFRSMQKLSFTKTHPWYQKGWGPLAYRMLLLTLDTRWVQCDHLPESVPQDSVLGPSLLLLSWHIGLSSIAWGAFPTAQTPETAPVWFLSARLQSEILMGFSHTAGTQGFPPVWICLRLVYG